MLDKSKPYGEKGNNIYGIRYVQDGRFYRPNGDEVTETGELVGQVVTETQEPPVAGPQTGASTDENMEIPDAVPASFVFAADGNPFKTEKAAKTARTKGGMKDSHEVVEVNGGFALEPKG